MHEKLTWWIYILMLYNQQAYVIINVRPVSLTRSQLYLYIVMPVIQIPGSRIFKISNTCSKISIHTMHIYTWEIYMSKHRCNCNSMHTSYS